ncbi:MAG: toll/interleukin-1 receptor domain-containing protein [Nitrosospira sp.]
MGGIFISYRREDSQGEALHLFDKLRDRFGADSVFMDVTGIEPGTDFRKVIDSAVSSCDVLITLIGKKWLDSLDEASKRRIDNPKDFVRIETGAALRRDIPVIPVLVQGQGMPRPDELPSEIEALAWRNAFEIRHNRWDVDVAELVKALEKIVPIGPTSGTLPSTIYSPTNARPDDERKVTLPRGSLSEGFIKRRWILLAAVSLIAGSGILLLVYPLNPSQQTFPEPMYDEYRLDSCYEWGTRCGEEPATEWCKQKGFKHAIDFSMETVGNRGIPTKLIGTQAICREAFCTAYKYVECKS